MVSSRAGRGISADHKLEGGEGAGQRRTEGARDRDGGAASDHDALIGAAQMECTSQRGREPAGKLGVSRFKSHRSADAGGPDRLQRDDHAAAERHPPAMQALAPIGSISRAGRQRCQHEERYPEQQPAKTRNQQRPPRLDAELAGKALPHFKIEQQHAQAFDRRTHGRDHQAADGSDQRRQDHQAEFVGTDEGAEPTRRLKIDCRRGHFRVPSAAARMTARPA